MMLPEHEPVALQIVGGIGEIERLARCGILGRGHLVLPAAQPFGCPRLTHEGEGLRDDKGEILAEQGIHLSRARQRGIFPDAEDPLPRSEEHTSELQSLMRTSYAVFYLQKKT